jgi:4-hydroxy-tetrahydrodipicolinate reductase
MGAALHEAIAAAGHALAGGIDQGGDALALAQESDVLVDFSAPGALEFTLDAAIHARTPIVIGTTGLADRHHWLIDAAAVSLPVLQTGNTSLGVTLLAHLVKEAAQRLGEDWDIEIAETHHRMKLDASSGTALLLGEAAAAGRGVRLDEERVAGRDGVTGARKAGTIGFAALRGGSVSFPAVGLRNIASGALAPLVASCVHASGEVITSPTLLARASRPIASWATPPPRSAPSSGAQSNALQARARVQGGFV